MKINESWQYSLAAILKNINGASEKQRSYHHNGWPKYLIFCNGLRRLMAIVRFSQYA
jgi:hypothetical protein